MDNLVRHQGEQVRQNVPSTAAFVCTTSFGVATHRSLRPISQAPHVFPTQAGVVYIVTSPNLQAVGSWTGSEAELLQSYGRMYRDKTQLVLEIVQDAIKAEVIMHDIFADRHLGYGLFNKQGWHDYVAALQLL